MYPKHMGRFYSTLDKYFYYLCLGLFIFIPLYPKFPLLSVKGTYVAIRLEDIIISLVFLVWFILNLTKLKIYLKQSIYVSILLFWFIGGVAFISGLLITNSVTPGLGFLNWLRRVEYMGMFFIAATTFRSLNQVKVLLKVSVVIVFLVLIYGFGQQWLNFPIISTTNKEFSKGLILYLTPDARVNSSFAGHYDLAVFLSIVLILLGSLFFYFKKTNIRVGFIVFGLFNFLLLGLTAARTSFAATLVGLVISFWLNGKKLLIVLLIAVSLLTVGLIPELRHRLVATITVNLLKGGGAKYVPVQPSASSIQVGSKGSLMDEATVSDKIVPDATISADIAPGEPINTTELGVYRSYGIRLDVEWPRAVRAFVKNPIVGTGYSSLTIATDNDFLRSLGEVGVLGTLSLVLIFYILISKMIFFIKESSGFERSFIVGVLCSTVALLFTGIFIDILEASKIALLFWFLLGVSWSVMKGFKDD